MIYFTFTCGGIYGFEELEKIIERLTPKRCCRNTELFHWLCAAGIALKGYRFFER